jgi:antitoxin component of MazEF toxin-antitoxin module
VTEELFITTRVRLWGGSYVLVLPPQVVKVLGLVHRDVVGVRKIGKCLLVKQIKPGEVMPVSAEEVAAATRDGAR